MAVLVPYWITGGWQGSGAPLALQALGALLLAAGVGVLAHTVIRFAVEGLGTPFPAAPTEKLVVGGLYRYVRNPMYLAVIAMILGQAAILGERQPARLRRDPVAHRRELRALLRGAHTVEPVRRAVRRLPPCGQGVVAAGDALERRPRQRDRSLDGRRRAATSRRLTGIDGTLPPIDSRGAPDDGEVHARSRRPADPGPDPRHRRGPRGDRGRGPRLHGRRHGDAHDHRPARRPQRVLVGVHGVPAHVDHDRAAVRPTRRHVRAEARVPLRARGVRRWGRSCAGRRARCSR